MKKVLSLCFALAIVIGCFAMSTAAADDMSSAYLRLASVDDNIATVEVCVNDSAMLGISNIGFLINYEDSVVLVNCERVLAEGELRTSVITDVRPFMISWNHTDETLPYEETVICTIQIALDDATIFSDKTLEMTLSLDPDNPSKNLSGDVLTDRIAVIGEYKFEDLFPGCFTDVGDANGDGKVNLSDVSLTLKYIAKWSDLSIDLNRADVLNDGKVILSDVSMMLKHIAKWTSVRMGHNDTREVIKKPTCKAAGETKLTCKECGSTATVYPNPVPCDYRKTVVKAATCGAEGTDKYTCIMCGDSYTKTVAATGKHTYSGGKCTVCGKADPSVTKGQLFANFIKQEGEYIGNGIYSIASYIEEDGIIFSCDYDTETNAIYFSSMVVDESYDVTSSVYIDIPVKGSSSYKLTYLCYDHVTDYDYFIASCKINPKTLSGLTSVKFTDYSVTKDKANESSHAKLAKSLADSSVYYAKLVLLVSGLDITVEDFGFTGYN